MRINKIILVLIIIFFIISSVNAAIVSDNDGSAFVTNELSEHLIQFNLS